MTAVDVLDDLAFVMHAQGYCGEVCVCTDDARALLPVVDRIANERAAAELESRARGVTARASEENEEVQAALDDEAARLLTRATALRASNGAKT